MLILRNLGLVRGRVPMSHVKCTTTKNTCHMSLSLGIGLWPLSIRPMSLVTRKGGVVVGGGGGDGLQNDREGGGEQ